MRITAALADTSFLFALTNPKDRNHDRVLNVARILSDKIIIPTPVLPEISYLIASRLGHNCMRRFLNELVINDSTFEAITANDLKRVVEILEQYAESQLDFVDATIIAIAERRKICRILTLDRRDFSIVRPRHCSYFEILP
ncbi:MAG: VapC toxin family PIN domain ribonuclease [Candidatus Parabeggiatoa sp. nov. 3]|jgi:predicted nucleic acid-binding protein|nr:MAG: VapC toxin family PIN domain ribonuclease [Gammaproteobacteria bacterium]RKZ67859.1 MAG: VapC toxin family PIN domain ribonuclease [Gammaproteobacteria bacterium]RKZ86510.1 MAG: VapC toxin family PIN domain ribonuclease [Gammaproteobacteria bacterium]